LLDIDVLYIYVFKRKHNYFPSLFRQNDSAFLLCYLGSLMSEKLRLV